MKELMAEMKDEGRRLAKTSTQEQPNPGRVDVALWTNGRSFATFVYSGANSRWILAATN